MSFLSHMTFGTNDLARAKRFYDAAMGALDLKQVHAGADFVAYGRGETDLPWLWIMPPYDGLPATWGNGTHYSFMVESRAMVEAFHAAALANGGSDEGAPGLRPRYSEYYFAAYVRDPDGNKLQALTYRGEGEIEPYPQTVSHITLGTNDRMRSKVFYDAVMAPLGLLLIDEDEMAWGYGVAGESFPVLYTHETFDGRPATWGNGSHVALLAPTREAVAAFHEAGLAQGGFDEGAPGPRPDYGEHYYGAYLRDLDGNKLQAVCYAAPR